MNRVSLRAAMTNLYCAISQRKSVILRSSRLLLVFYVSLNNVKPGFQINFEKKAVHEVDSLGEPYDYDSIMHYHKFALTKDPAKETLTPIARSPPPIIGQRVKPSVGDVKQMNRLYKCPSCGQTFVEPTGRFSYPSVDALHASADATDKNIQLEMPTYLRRSPGTAYPSQSEGQILSATSSNSHPLYCRWRVLARRGERIVFKFLRMGLLPPSNGNNCSEEYVEVRDGYNSTSHLIGRYCGSTLPKRMATRTARMLIEYSRLAGQPASGFSILYRVVCGAKMKGNKGNISSLGYPGNYPANKTCLWTITVPKGYSVLLTFETFDLEDDTKCQYDYLQVFDGTLKSSPLLKTMCGANLPEPITSTGNTMALRFVSDNVIQKLGFAATFQKFQNTQVDHCAKVNHGCEHICVNFNDGYKCLCNVGYNRLADGKSCKFDCGGYLMADTGYITSPGFPANYPPNSRCVWKIKVPTGFSVLLTFQQFDLGDQSDCPYDYIEIRLGSTESSPLLRKLCSSQLPDPVASKTNEMLVIFVSNKFFNHNGFKANFNKVSPAIVGQCSTKNYGCEHTCVDILDGYRCACRHGYYLLPDGKSCQSLACGDHLRIGISSIASPQFPDNYPPNSKCIWTISAPAGFFVVLKIMSFDLGDQSECAYDYVEIFDGPSLSSPFISKLCGAGLSQMVYTTKNSRTLRFISDYGIQNRGFEATYWFEFQNHRRMI
uniref:Tolloid-like protein 1 n=1 Tax=Schistocephalus solidus TaxID=70667 RepID=A0A0X3NN85_SCHSO